MDESLLTALFLSKQGFGTPVQILEMPTDIVLAASQYAGFLSDYQNTYTALNSK